MTLTNVKPNNLMLAKAALMAVVFVDVMGQGLLFPILNSLMMDPSLGFLPANTPQATRHFDYGLVMAVFYLAWLLGSVYISKISDSIGRKQGILICLLGNLIGYVLTILALGINSLWVLVLGRFITGFTAGNQPIAQAAMVDMSRDDAEKTRNMGYIVTGLSLGLVAGPIIGGVFSDKTLLGSVASLSLPIYVAIALVVITIGLIVFCFHDARQERVPLRIKPQEIVLLLWQVTERPLVMRVALVYFWYSIALNVFYIFMDNYLTSRFKLGLTGTSAAMVVFGATLALASAYLVAPMNRRFSKRVIIVGASVINALGVILFILTPSVWATFLPIIPIGAAFAVGYPTIISLFSASADETEQGWVMGVQIALFAIGSGAVSFIGGELMGEGIRNPFYLSIGATILTLGLIATIWQSSTVRRITG
jgi:DHA1 family tetracycline resistance protein-like MFS transporter